MKYSCNTATRQSIIQLNAVLPAAQRQAKYGCNDSGDYLIAGVIFLNRSEGPGGAFVLGFPDIDTVGDRDEKKTERGE